REHCRRGDCRVDQSDRLSGCLRTQLRCGIARMGFCSGRHRCGAAHPSRRTRRDRDHRGKAVSHSIRMRATEAAAGSGARETPRRHPQPAAGRLGGRVPGPQCGCHCCRASHLGRNAPFQGCLLRCVCLGGVGRGGSPCGRERPGAPVDRTTAGDAGRRSHERDPPEARPGMGPAARRSAVPGAAEEIRKCATGDERERGCAMNEFVARLKQRKLVQWALAYAAGAFALLQGVDMVAAKFGWPDAIERGLIIAACAGFFITLLLAWYHGERGAQRVSGIELLLLALLLAVGGAFMWRFSGSHASASTPAVASLAKPPSASAPARADIPAKSIAVLPFENLSDNKDNVYFSDGLSEEILNSLARIDGLRVIGRTS